MSLGYALGGLVHGRYPNRAVADICAHKFFYPAFAGSYLAMVASCWAWSGTPPRGPRAHDAALTAAVAGNQHVAVQWQWRAGRRRRRGPARPAQHGGPAEQHHRHRT